jgi:hypothetical protein
MRTRKRSDNSERTEGELLLEISHKLDILIGMTAIQGKEPKAQIKILTKLGLSSREIGGLLNIHPDSVRHSRSKS